MIRVVLGGRLGNQMFKYAAGRRLALKHGVRLILDVSRYGLRNRGDYGLGYFPVAAKAESPLLSLICYKLTGRFLWQFGRSLYCESSHHYNPRVLSLPRSCTLMGQFQSEKYFHDISAMIRREFSFERISESQQTREMSGLIRSTPSVSVHVRRGDYTGDKRYDVCSLEYYRKAMAYFREHDPKTVFYIFSDDLKGCAESFGSLDCRYCDVDQSQVNPVNDMRLMSLCRHHIIANSSYSWWGAWLNASPDKRVLAPHIWFGGDDVPIADKLCEGWIPVVF